MKDYLKQQRLKFKLTKSEAAKELGITIDLLNAWEDGRAIPNEKYFDKIIQLYKVSMKQILNEINTVSFRVNDDIFTKALCSKKNLIDSQINLDTMELTLSYLDIRVLFTISLTTSLGASPYKALSNIIGNPIELNAAVSRLKKAHLIEYCVAKGSLCISDFGSIVLDIIEQEALYDGCCYKAKITEANPARKHVDLELG